MKSRTRHHQWPTAALADGLRAYEKHRPKMRPEHVDLMNAAADRLEALRNECRSVRMHERQCGCTESSPCGLHIPIIITAPRKRRGP